MMPQGGPEGRPRETHGPTHRFHAVTITSVRYGIPVIAIILLGPACGGEPPKPGPEYEALLQRLDAMDERLDALEEALGEPRPGDEPPASVQRDPLGVPRLAPATGPETSATLSVRLTTTSIEIDGKPVAREDVLDLLRDVARIQPGTRLSLLTEPGVPYNEVIDTLDLAREAGLTDVVMSARVHGEGEGAVTTAP